METNKENSWEKDLEKYFLENYAKATAYQLENYIKSFIRSLLETSTKQARLEGAKSVEKNFIGLLPAFPSKETMKRLKPILLLFDKALKSSLEEDKKV